MARNGYARLSNGLWLNDKVNDLVDRNPHAFAVWTLAISYCSDQLNDGVLTARALRRIGADEQDLADLVAFGMFDTLEDGSYQVHDYLEHQNSRESVESEREASKERMSRRRASKRSGEPKPNTKTDTETRSDEVRANTETRSDERSGEHTAKFLGLNQNQNQNQESSNEDSLPQPPHGGRGSVEREYTAEFERFWSVYPRREGKRTAFDAWRRALRKTGHEHLLAVADRYAKDPNRRPAYTLTPANWLDGEHWLDDPQPPRDPTPARASPQPTKSRSQANREANMANTWKYMTAAERAEYQRKHGGGTC
ncbi:hypothetical protein CS006_10500 [Bifidobacterium primatium]|uniref:DUF4373 domain-containing protein n=1 Tax=Bifidobacterium primatium TaxID=2045438 RepID=A0A2M9H6E7_9BIFI|nr:hypothetical protein [Bifidobacterium primatium]PJM72357.1 hypothetical protein CS006_10500 [Bifidobacterium primatium]